MRFKKKVKIRNYYINTRKVLTGSYPFSRFLLLYSYFKLLIKSFLRHRFYTRSNGNFFVENLLGYQIRFFSYSQVINLFEEIFIHEVYKFDSRNSKPCIIDCGSNIGMSILYFKCLYPHSTITAFEPDPNAFRLIQENVKQNKLTNVTVLNFALDYAPGKVILFGNQQPGGLTNSLITSSDRKIGTTIFAKKLSEFIDQSIDLLKIDVEGAEGKIIDDLIFHKKLSAIKKLIIEFHPKYANSSLEDFISKLKSHRFSCQIVKDTLHPLATEYIIYCSSEG